MLFRKKRCRQPMTEKEKALALNHIEAVIACGGGKMTPDMKQTALDIMDGKIAEDEAIENIKKKYGFSS